MAAELSVVEFEAVREASVKVRLLLLHVHEGLTQLIQLLAGTSVFALNIKSDDHFFTYIFTFAPN